ncbi:MAG: DUF975 family protein [Emergencia sp.]|nr:DUF975 family protein [Emergencia sp.]
MNNIVRETSSEIRAIARTALKGNWGKVTLGVFVYYVLISTIPALMTALLPNAAMSFYLDEMGEYVTVSYVANLYNLFLSGALTVGLCSFFLAFFRRKEINPGHLFNGFEYFFKSLGLMVLYTIIVSLFTLLLIIPGIIASFALSQCFIILADHPEKGIVECLKESKALMKGNKGKLFCLMFSFIGWLILATLVITAISFVVLMFASPLAYYGAVGLAGVSGTLLDLVLSIPVIVVMAYMLTAETVFYELASGNLQAKPAFNDEDYHF